MAADILYFLRRAETEAVRAIGYDSEGAGSRVAAVHQEMCLLYTGQAVAGLLAAARERRRRGSTADQPAD